MTTLLRKLASTAQREDSGAQTNSRYHYQALCGLVLVLERHNLDGDYAMVFEYHDDIALFDNHTAPENVQFYQVKSKSAGNWTVSALTKRKSENGNEKHSFLGKMYENVLAFGDAVEKTTFLSNAQTNFAPDNKHNFSLSECSTKDLEKLQEKLGEEFSSEDTIKTNVLWIDRTNLSLDDADAHAKGKVDEFVVDHLGEVEFSLSALFKAITDECDRKSRAADVDLNDFEQVVAQRGITRADADAWLSVVSSTVNCPPWEHIAPDINLPALRKARLGREWNSYRIEVLNPNEAVRKARRTIRNFIEANDLEELSVDDLLDEVLKGVLADVKIELAVAPNERIMAMILYETYSIQ